TGKAMRGTIDGFAGRRVVVIGDLILDEYLFGKPVRISREAPVLILRFAERQVFLGGAANASHNAHALGARETPIGAAGRDGARVDAIVVSDYGYGTVTPRIFEHLKTLAHRANAVVSVDSRYQIPRFTGVTAATPNEAELEQLTGMPADDERTVEKGGRQLLERLDARLLLVTRGSRGMALLERDGATTFIPIHGTDEIADVTGAGDTVISTFTLALASGATPLQAATLANVAGGIVVMKRGTATVAPSEPRQAISLHDS